MCEDLLFLPFAEAELFVEQPDKGLVFPFCIPLFSAAFAYVIALSSSSVYGPLFPVR
jgi:hypothetical protein